MKALEGITLNTWYGIQILSIGTTYTNISFVDATNRGKFSSSDNDIKSGNAVTSGFIGWGDTHRVEMNVDTGIDLGKRTYYTGTSGAFVSGHKGYFNMFDQYVQMSAGQTYYLDGSYRFLPTIPETEPTPPVQETLTLNKNTITVERVGDTDTLTATHTPSSPSDVFTWSTSNANVATVSNGVVTVHGIGTATITVTCGQLSTTATVTQTTIKAEKAYAYASSKSIAKAGNDTPTFIKETESDTQAVGGWAYSNGDTDLHIKDATDIECIRVPYGATKMKYTTTNYSINSMNIVDTTNILDNGFPAWVSQATSISASDGATVEYGQAFVFNGTAARITAVTEVYFE